MARKFFSKWGVGQGKNYSFKSAPQKSHAHACTTEGWDINETMSSLELAITQFRRIVACQTVALYRVFSGQNTLQLVAFSSSLPQPLQEQLPLNEGLLGAVVKQKQIISMAPIRAGYRGILYYHSHLDKEIAAFKGYPILDQSNEIHAVLFCDDSRPQLIANIESVQGDEFVPLIAAIFHESMKMKKMAVETSEVKHLWSRMKNTNQSIHQKDVLEEFLKAIHFSAPFDFGTIVFHEAAGHLNQIVSIHHQNELKENLFLGKEFVHDERENLVSWVIENSKAMIYNQIKTSQKTIKLFGSDLNIGGDFNAVLMIPLAHHQVSLGALVIGRTQVESFSPAEEQICKTLSKQFSASIQNALLYEQMEKMATLDHLTGLYNHRYFKECLDKNIARASRQMEKIALIMMDIDYFKDINDQFGHLAGDHVLSEIAKMIKDSIRRGDVASRYGGEEFSLVMPNADEASAIKLATRLRKNIFGKSFVYLRREITVSVSMGIALYPGDATTRSTLIEKADQALYAAKKNGRNRCILAAKRNESFYSAGVGQSPSSPASK
jgi:diguanylate cyclase (GGDEF)-like protein